MNPGLDENRLDENRLDENELDKKWVYHQEQSHGSFFKISHSYNSYTAFNFFFTDLHFFSYIHIFFIRALNSKMIRQIVPANRTIQMISLFLL